MQLRSKSCLSYVVFNFEQLKCKQLIQQTYGMMKGQILFLLISMERECLGFDTGSVKALCVLSVALDVYFKQDSNCGWVRLTSNESLRKTFPLL